MKWTKEKPKVDGWYWIFEEEFSPVPEVVNVMISPDGIFFDYGEDSYLANDDFKKAKWAGPIARPK